MWRRASPVRVHWHVPVTPLRPVRIPGDMSAANPRDTQRHVAATCRVPGQAQTAAAKATLIMTSP